MTRQQTVWVELAEGKLRLRTDCGLQQLLGWEKLPVSHEFIGKWARAKQVCCIVPSLAPPLQAAPQHSKEGCPALVKT